jgi:catechol 2,3-dioxygenase-like lactoylglutathione lyase family enzyme
MLYPETIPIHSKDVVTRKDSTGRLLFQVRTDEMHFISEDAFTLFSLCDGSRTIAQIEAILIPAQPGLAPHEVRAKIEQFIESRDLERSLKFYREIFDWPKVVDVPVYAEFELPDGLRLGLYGCEGFGRNTGQNPFVIPEGEVTTTEIYFRTDDVPSLIDRLEAAGARLLNRLTLRDWGDEAAYFADPDGNVLVVARSVDITETV